MTVKTSYQPGEPIWVDLATPDQGASAAFYGALLGWTSTAPDPELGGYANYRLDGRMVAGNVPLMSPDQPVGWSVYVCSDDAGKTAALVEQAGGSTVAPPMDVRDLGRMAIFTDAAGAGIGVWQPGTHTGTELVDQVGTVGWVELATEQRDAACAFYATAFGWTPKPSPGYLEFEVAGATVAGCTDTSQGTTGWLPYFTVADPSASTEQATALGGTVVLPLTTFDGGACTIVRDPQGAVFGLLHHT